MRLGTLDEHEEFLEGTEDLRYSDLDRAPSHARTFQIA